MVNIGMFKQEQHIKLTMRRIGNIFVTFRRDPRGFPDSEIPLPAVEHFLMHLSKEFIEPRAVLAERGGAGIPFRAGSTRRHGRTPYSRKLPGLIYFLGDQGDHIHTETIDAAVHPPVHHGIYRLAHTGVFPVQIRLFL